MNIRKAEIKDAENMLNMMLELDDETEYMLYEPGERSTDSRKMEATISRAIVNNNLLLVAEEGKEIVGFISADRGMVNRIKHAAYIVVGIRKEFRNQGIGSEFFEELDLWARENRIIRLELTVMCNNNVAKHLYENNGFKVEGIKEKSCFINNKYIDEYYMSKIYE